MASKKQMGRSVPTRVLVVDDEQLIADLVGKLLEGLGVTDIHTYIDGESAWSALMQQDFDFVVVDWKLPAVSGLTLFNRLRQHEKYSTVPILVTSGLLTADDFSLLGDYPCSALLEKPFSHQAFEQKVTSLCQERQWYLTNMTAVDGLIRDFRKSPGDHIIANTKKLLKNFQNPIPVLTQIARKLNELGYHEHAEALLRDALEINRSNVPAVLEMAKVYHYRGDHKQASRILKKVAHLSPLNVERLLFLGEVSLAEKKPDEAKLCFEKALKIDPESLVAQAGVVVANNMQTHLFKSAQDVPLTFASMLNSIGISLVRSGKRKEGIEQYKAAMPFLHTKETMARLMFNVALGYLRWGKREDAMIWFKQSATMGGKRFAKSAKYLERIMKRQEEAATAEQEIEKLGIEEEPLDSAPTLNVPPLPDNVTILNPAPPSAAAGSTAENNVENGNNTEADDQGADKLAVV